MSTDHPEWLARAQVRANGQYSVSLQVTLADFVRSNTLGHGYTLRIPMPIGVEVKQGHVTVTNTFNDTGTATLIIGHADDTDEYTGTPVNLKSAARTAIVPTGYIASVTANKDLILTYVPENGNATKGNFNLHIEYVDYAKADTTVERLA